MAGQVRTGDRVWDKPAEKVFPDLEVEIRPIRGKYVSAGGLKLERALDAFQISPEGLNCLDIGASTGGFTHVLLSRNAAGVVALDVGYGLLDWSVRRDKRVRVIERTNFRLVPDDFFEKPFDLIVIDVSFISLKVIVPKAVKFLKHDGNLLALIKPQFEARPDQVGEKGLVRDSIVHQEIIDHLKNFFTSEGISLLGVKDVAESDPKKNREFFSWWKFVIRP